MCLIGRLYCLFKKRNIDDELGTGEDRTCTLERNINERSNEFKRVGTQHTPTFILLWKTPALRGEAVVICPRSHSQVRS